MEFTSLESENSTTYSTPCSTPPVGQSAEDQTPASSARASVGEVTPVAEELPVVDEAALEEMSAGELAADCIDDVFVRELLADGPMTAQMLEDAMKVELYLEDDKQAIAIARKKLRKVLHDLDKEQELLVHIKDDQVLCAYLGHFCTNDTRCFSSWSARHHRRRQQPQHSPMKINVLLAKHCLSLRNVVLMSAVSCEF